MPLLKTDSQLKHRPCSGPLVQRPTIFPKSYLTVFILLIAVRWSEAAEDLFIQVIDTMVIEHASIIKREPAHGKHANPSCLRSIGTADNGKLVGIRGWAFFNLAFCRGRTPKCDICSFQVGRTKLFLLT